MVTLEHGSVRERCPRCGTPFSTEARGNCPACLLRRLVADEEPCPPFPAPSGYSPLVELGRGGAGVVWKARQHGLDREVALKVLAAGLLASEPERARLRREAEAMARLRHPHIVAIHEVGEVEGQIFLAMELVDGGTLADRLRGGPLDPKTAAALLRDAADAVSHAHARGVIHRDLKPANVLLDKFGAPHLADFGLAKLLPPGAAAGAPFHTPFDLTLTGHALGTVHYLAPEQAGASPRDVTPAVDVHALGAILYHCLGGRPPYLGVSFAETLRQVMEENPPALRTLNPLVPRDLENICLKCLRKHPAQRYATAAALRKDLDCFLTRRPVTARPVPNVVKLWGWMRRFPATSFFLSATIALLISGIWISSRHASVEKGLRVRAEHAVRRLEFSGLDQLQSQGQREVALRTLTRLVRENPDDLVIAKRLAWTLQEEPLALPVSPPVGMAGTTAAHVSLNHKWLAYGGSGGEISVRDLSLGGFPVVWSKAHQGFTDRVRVSADGQYVAGSGAGQLALWDRHQSNAVVQPVAEGRRLVAMDFSTDSKLLATADDLGNLELWDLPSLRPCQIGWRQPVDVRFIQFSPDSKRLSTGSSETPLRVWDIEAGRLHLTLTGNSAQHQWSRDSQRIVVCDHNGGWVEVWDVIRAAMILRIGPIPAPTSAIFSPDERLIATATYTGSVRLWRSDSGQPSGPAMAHPQWAKTLDFSPDGSLLATVCDDGSARIWSVESGRQFCQPMAHPAPLRICSFAGGNSFFFTYTGAGWGQFWSLEQGAEGLAQLVAPALAPALQMGSMPVAVSTDDRLVATAAANGMVQIANLHESDVSLRRVLRHPEAVHQVTFSPDSQSLATISTNQMIRIWGSEQGELRSTLHFGDQLSTCCKYSPDGNALVIGGINGEVILLRVDSGQLIRNPRAHAARTRDIVFAPGGRFFATSSEDYTLKFWNSVTLAPELPPIPHTSTLNRLAFSPQGDVLFAACEDHVIHRWQMPSARPVLPDFRLEGPAYSLEVSANGKLLLNACDDGSARLWDSQKGKLVHRFPMAGQMLASLSKDGTTVATGNTEGAFKLWDAESGLALSGLFRQQKEWVQPVFTSDGNWIIAGSRFIEARQWPVPPISEPLPDWLIRFAEAVSGRDLDPAGAMIPSSPEERWNAVRTVRALRENTPLTHWAKRLAGANARATLQSLPANPTYPGN